MKDNPGFTDTHSHILFSVDDGAPNIDISLDMLLKEAEEGAAAVFLTPHFYEGERNSSHLKERFEELRERAKTKVPGLKLFLGNEIFCMYDPSAAVMKGEALSYDGGKYVLCEFSPSNTMEAIKSHLESFLREGYVPVIAHAERYRALFGKIEHMREVRDMGALIQINCETIEKAGFLQTGYFKKLFREDLIFAVGTDAHNLTTRAPRMKEAFKKTAALAGEEKAKKIFCYNPKAFVTDKER